MRGPYHSGLVGALIVTLLGVAYLFLQQGAEAPLSLHSANAASAPAEKVVSVEAVQVSVDTVLETIHAVASLKPNEAVVVSPEIAGRIARMPFAEGDKVEAGAVLVELDFTILQAELSKAQSELALAETNRNRMMSLAKQGTGSFRERDEAVAAYQSAQANLALAKARLEKSTITAPFSGVIGVRSVSIGAYVSPGHHIVELVDIDPIKVDFRVPELALPSLQPGQFVRVTVDALPGQVFDGEVYVIDPIVDANGRAIRLRAQIPNPNGRLSPGLFARVQIVVERRENALLIPEPAVFADGQARYVYRIVDGRAVQTEIELGQRQPGFVEVRSGVDRDTVVVTAGHQQIRDGSRVTIVKPRAGT
ncbi:efflux RND transporter periplasmic adaptor subunit [Sedimenticola selenatireducens]|uniref:Efflux RND transporter periplasmic adaptor subunit n=1 Tax=Sedimenticola selenatireducens TaxID=191960 RepID=A0A558DKH2_9GAMM|nr:efflux RND transporter periplasmic adaptor subunit [Sedimenticola selenatireducens]TVO71216.1 efflux RND transporter periplasmic adaptor subunit [Sedimenticola selenatireducens]TVT61518.1 MAG: efflux RND transporter periplasmic adaptor subunit [Sedimenticola selenatireducens]